CSPDLLSSSASEKSPQCSATKGLSLRSLAAWMARARSSLPVPVSPTTRTERSLSAARRPAVRTASAAALEPTNSSKPKRRPRCPDALLERAPPVELPPSPAVLAGQPAVGARQGIGLRAQQLDRGGVAL